MTILLIAESLSGRFGPRLAVAMAWAIVIAGSALTFWFGKLIWTSIAGAG